LKIQLLSDLHLESEAFEPEPVEQAELLVLAGDIDSTWAGYERFAGWPVPVLVVAGNHEFDGREWHAAWQGLGELCDRLGFELLEQRSLLLTNRAGETLRFVGCTRWSDFDLFGDALRPKAMKAADYFLRYMGAHIGGQALDAPALREQALASRHWLAGELASQGDWQRTVAITHFAPSLRSADPRYGRQPGTASFCNADDDLLPHAQLWLHGHLHCRFDYEVADAHGRRTRVLSQARGLAAKGECTGFDAGKLIDA
jgi:hypothetical protein